jgi:VCBS repeat-containing protein
MASKKAPAPKPITITVGYNESKNFLVTNEDARGDAAWKIDFAKLLGANASVFSGLKDLTLTSAGGAIFSVKNGLVSYDAGTGFDQLAAGQKAVDTVSYTTKLPNGSTATLNLKFLVKGLNDAPVGVDDSFDFTEDQTLSGASVLGNDSDADAGATLTAFLVNDVQHGDLVLSADGTFSYTPDKDYAGVDAFTYRVFDGTAYSQAVTVTLNGIEVAEPVESQSFGIHTSGGVASWLYHPDDHNSFTRDYITPGYDHLDISEYYSHASQNSIDYYVNPFVAAIDGYFSYNRSSGPTTMQTSIWNEATGEYDQVEYVETFEDHYYNTRHYDVILEFDVSGAAGLVNGATFAFTTQEVVSGEYIDNVALGGSAAAEFEFYVYSGNGFVSMDDHGAGVLAGSISLPVGVNGPAEVSLDPDVVNSVLADGSSYLGIAIRGTLEDPMYGPSISDARKVTGLYFTATSATLDFLYL